MTLVIFWLSRSMQYLCWMVRRMVRPGINCNLTLNLAVFDFTTWINLLLRTVTYDTRCYYCPNLLVAKLRCGKLTSSVWLICSCFFNVESACRELECLALCNFVLLFFRDLKNFLLQMKSNSIRLLWRTSLEIERFFLTIFLTASLGVNWVRVNPISN